jgi:hypothetical protein
MTYAEDTSEEKLRAVTDVDSVLEYLNNYVRPYTKWYERVAKKNHRYLSWSRVLAIMTGVLATIFAACPEVLAKSISPYGTELTRYLAAIFSALTTVASGMLQNYFAQAARIREAGRVKSSYIEQLVSLTFLHEPMTDRERSAFKRKIAADMRDIEIEHGAVVGMQGN